MARINIEDSLYKDARFFSLLMRIRDIDTATGCMVRAWTLAQKWYVTPERMIPLKEWKAQGMRDEIIEVGLAEIVGEKVRMKGADEQFQWLLDRKQAGKLGGLKSQENRVKQTQANASKRNPLTLSPSLSLRKEEESQKKPKAAPQAAALPPLVELWNKLSASSLPKVRTVHPKGTRRKAAEARWAEKPDALFWSEVIDRISGSDFCLGANDRQWKADIDFLLRPETAAKVLEGKYDNRSGVGANSIPDNVVRQQKRLIEDQERLLRERMDAEGAELTRKIIAGEAS